MFNVKLSFSEKLTGKLVEDIDKAVELDEELESLTHEQKIAISNLVNNQLEQFFHSDVELD